MRNRFHIDDLICPYTRAGSEVYVPLSEVAGSLESAVCSYPIHAGVADMRMPSNRDSTSYDAILPLWTPPEDVRPESILAPYGLSAADVEGKVVLLGGTGVGRELLALRQLKPKTIYALDFSIYIQSLALGIADENINFICGDLCNLPFRRDLFDLVVSPGIIQHTRTPELAVREMIRCLKPNGKLTIGNFYPPGLHNRRVSIHRLKRMFHRMAPDVAKTILARQARVYTWLVKTGLWRVHRLHNLPFLVEFNNIPGQSYDYYFENALDYYLPAYRHSISYDEIADIAAQVASRCIQTRKGVILQKQHPSDNAGAI